MKNRILSLVMALVLVLSCVFAMVSCGPTGDTGGSTGGNTGGNTGGGTSGGGGDTGFPWNKTTLIFQMSENSNGNELTSQTKRYLAGETNDAEDIDKSVDKRNALAEQNTKVDVTYTYWPDDEDHKWGQNIDKIFTSVNSQASSTPDIFSVFVYDMVGSMLRGCFANALATTRGNNYFRFTEKDYNGMVDDEGYMYEYMTSLTLSSKKMYLIASDYFTDLVRAFFVVPVNIKLLTGNAKDVTIAETGGGTGAYADFIKLVEDRKWNYELLKKYCNEVVGENESSAVDLNGIVGFALGADSGLSPAGLLYTTPITIIERTGTSVMDYEYSYPKSSAALTDFCVKLDDLMKSKGAYVQSGSLDTIRQAFANNHVLFGGVICVGSLEDEVYQKMRGGNNGGFGVVPVPLYSATYTNKDGEVVDTPYLTQIHNVGRIGGIAKTTTKFSQCSAFLNYVSTTSTEILDEYYEWKLSVGAVGGTAAAGANEKMLKMIRSNVRSAFDKVFEDALGIYGGFSKDLYHKVIQNGGMSSDSTKSEPYQIGSDMTRIYKALFPAREAALAALVKEFNGATYTD